MKSSLFPDVNVWLALTHDRHVHHGIAVDWLHSGTEQPVYFCRFTQLGLLRLLTSEVVMGVDVMNQRRAWRTYRRWFDDERVAFHREPETEEFERVFHDLSSRAHPSPKVWADAYLAAFAQTAGLTLATFDKAFRRMRGAQVTILPSA